MKPRMVALFAAMCAAMSAQPAQYLISTVAGGGILPSNGPALKTPIGGAQDIAIDSSGNIFFTSSFCIFKVDPNGLLTRFAGTGISGDAGDGGHAIGAQFTSPTALALDRSGNLFVADSGTGRIRKIAVDGTISTIAGTGKTCCYNDGSGDGGPATSAQLFYPYQLAVDSAGNVYVGEWNTARVRQVSADGIIRTVIGVGGNPGYSGDGGPASKAQIGAPWGLAFDPSGNLYISDAIPGDDIDPVATHIRKVTPDGIISTIAGSGGVGFAGDGGAALSAQFSAPGALAATGSGDVYVADGARIRRISADGTIDTIAGNGIGGYAGDGGPANQAVISSTSYGQWLGLAADMSGDLYIADTANLRIREIAGGGTIATVAGNGNNTCCFSGDGGPAVSAQLYGPVGVAAAPDGSLYISDTFNNRIRRIDAGGSITTVAGDGTPGIGGDHGPAASAQITIPAGLAIDASGNVYFADAASGRIRKIAVDGTISTVAGTGMCCFSGDGGSAASAQLNWPEDVAVDNSGRVYIADSLNNRVRVVTPDGLIATAAGNGATGYVGDGGPATAASLSQPEGVAVDGAGNIYIADTYNHCIRKVSPNGTISTVAGSGLNGVYRISGDGGPATAASLTNPSGIKVDPDGNLYIADGVAVRMVSSAGIISTLAGTGVLGISGDGGQSAGAEIGAWGISLDRFGAIFIADPWDNIVRKLTPAAGGGMSIGAVQGRFRARRD